MNILTGQEIEEIRNAVAEQAIAQMRNGEKPSLFAHAIIAATVAKLAAGVSVEPDYQRLVYKVVAGDNEQDPDDYRDYYKLETLQTAVAAARAQALSEAAAICDRNSQSTSADEIRALIGGNE